MAELLLTGKCEPGHSHAGEPVTTLDGEHVGFVCRHCLVRLRDMRAFGYGRDRWQPYADDGRELPILPDPGRKSRW